MMSFVIRLHDATKAGRHHDLQLNGDSWAVPKGVPLSSGRRVLAIKTQHHSPEDRYFEGEIPDGQYGAGMSTVIDTGEAQILTRRADYIAFKLLGGDHGGNYHLKHWHHTHWLLWKSL